MQRKEEEKERYIQLYFFSLLPNYINHDKLKNNHTWHFTAMQSLDSLAETTAVVRLLHAIIMS